MMTYPSSAGAPVVSIVIPANNEAGNLAALLAEISVALGTTPFEVVCVDDGSIDATPAELTSLAAERAWLRPICHAVSCGQSAAIRSGVLHARAAVVITLDGDGQNDPAFIPQFISKLAAGGPNLGLVAGQRVARKIGLSKKLQSHIANSVRSAILRDGTRDTGCGMKAFRRDFFLALPFFDGLHRFLPALTRAAGYEVAFVDVVDRPRRFGESHYGMWNRLGVGIVDLAGVWWLIRRRRALVRDING